MHVISLKRIKAKEILKKIEYKIKNNKDISDENIASLQLIAYTTYSETTLEILLKASKLVNQMNRRKRKKSSIIHFRCAKCQHA